MITGEKVTKIFCMVVDFCKFFDVMTAKCTLKPTWTKKISPKFYDIKGRNYADNDSFP